MPEQFNLDLRSREERRDYSSMSDQDLRVLFQKEMGLPIPSSRSAIIEALADPTVYLARREEAQNEDRNDLRQTYRN
jgi:hypothetical protein